jgi:hypothetical protein
MTFPTQIVVTKDGVEVFNAVAGIHRGQPLTYPGCEDSAARGFICFASPLIGCAYHYTSYIEAAERIARMGYITTITEAGADKVIQ